VLTTRVTDTHICTSIAQSAYFLGTLHETGTINMKNYGARYKKGVDGLDTIWYNYV